MVGPVIKELCVGNIVNVDDDIEVDLNAKVDETVENPVDICASVVVSTAPKSGWDGTWVDCRGVIAMGICEVEVVEINVGDIVDTSAGLVGNTGLERGNTNVFTVVIDKAGSVDVGDKDMLNAF